MDVFEKMDDHLDGSHNSKPPTHQNVCSPKNFCSNHPCCLLVSAAFKYFPQTTVMTFDFTSVFVLLLLYDRTYSLCVLLFRAL